MQALTIRVFFKNTNNNSKSNYLNKNNRTSDFRMIITCMYSMQHKKIEKLLGDGISIF